MSFLRVLCTTILFGCVCFLPVERVSAAESAASTTQRDMLGVTTTTTVISNIPSNIDIEELRRYWLDQVNALRVKRNLRALISDDRFVDTATEWSTHMAKVGRATHVRKNGQSMHAWIATRGVTFTKRNSVDGWKRNYFSENIAWDYTQNSMTGAKKALDNALRFMLAEAKTNGPHYRTIYHPDWNAVGVGFFFKPIGKGKYQLFTTMHYGSVVSPGKIELDLENQP